MNKYLKMTKKDWKILPLPDTSKALQIQGELNIPKALAQLLIQRQIDTFEKAKQYFKPEIGDLHNPFLMKGMDLAANRLHKAIENEEKILIYGDYDVDGTTSVSLVYLFLKQFHSNLAYYIPDRYKEGYGVSMQGMEYAKEHGYELIITLDCGIKANRQIAFAQDQGIDVIVCDHHTPGNELPRAYAILDPKQEDCNYPYQHLSGCGVGFKLMQAYCLEHDINQNIHLLKYLDILAVSIASDIVPMTGENRVLAYYGLKIIEQKPSPGIKAIMDIAGITDYKLSISDIVFKIGPRINAAGRIESGSKAVELLISENKEQALSIVSDVNNCNTTRKEFDKAITEEALQMIAADSTYIDRKSTVLFKEDWHKGVIGIVASRVIESFYKPTIILTESKGKATGSARSVDGFNVYEAIERCSHLLSSFGGHKYAAGLTMEIDKVQDFTEAFEDSVSKTITDEQLIPKINIDLEISLSDIDDKFQRLIARCEPFGPENMAPVFCTRNLIDSGNSRIVGESKEHVKLELMDPETGVIIDAIAFSFGHMIDEIKTKELDVCYTIEQNTFRGKTTIQLMVKDLKVSEN